MPVINANSVDPDQTPHSAASDLGLHCLPMSHLWDARHKWVNYDPFVMPWLNQFSVIASTGPDKILIYKLRRTDFCFLFLHDNIHWEYSLKVPCQSASHEYYNVRFCREIGKEKLLDTPAYQELCAFSKYCHIR